ncbi:hypothetical protein BGX31_005699 [Mortierella sp. GBA43]|nr:hypothetical protein BGX31_005699 [Mortierella sp. GBA43]
MHDSLPAPTNASSLQLLQREFVGRLDGVYMSGVEKTKADFLTAEGVLRIEEGKYSMASPLIDTFIRRFVIPQAYPGEPCMSIPLHEKSLDVVEALKQVVMLFDRDLIRYNRAYKNSGNIQVDGCHYKDVPRESVYDNQLLRILTNWFKASGYEATGQWHTHDDKGHSKYSDIVISKDNKPTVVMEILATATKDSILEHFERAMLYKEKIGASAAWMIHFTLKRVGVVE